MLGIGTQNARTRKLQKKMLGLLSGSRGGEGFGAAKVWYFSSVPAAFLSVIPSVSSPSSHSHVCIQRRQSPSVPVSLKFPRSPLKISPYLLLASTGSPVHSCSNP